MEERAFMERTRNVFVGFEIAEQIVDSDQTHHYFVMDGNIESNLRMIRQIGLFKSFYDGSKKYWSEETCGNLIPMHWHIKKAVVVIKREYQALTKLSSAIDEFMVLPDDEVEQLNSYAKEIINVHRNLHRDEYGSGSDRYDEADKMKMHHISSYRYVMRVPMSLPNEDIIMNEAMIVPGESLIKARKILEQNNWYKDNTVIICNGLGKGEGITSYDIWDDAIRILYAEGMQVFRLINLSSDKTQQTVPAKIPTVKAELDELGGLLKLGVKIIGGCTEDVSIATFMNYASQAVILSDSMEQNLAALNKLLGK